MASAEHAEGSLEYPRYLGRCLGIASKQVPKLVHGVRGQAWFAMETDVTRVLCEPVVKNRDVKGDGAHICGRHEKKVFKACSLYALGLAGPSRDTRQVPSCPRSQSLP